jgi:hypothetical protein
VRPLIHGQEIKQGEMLANKFKKHPVWKAGLKTEATVAISKSCIVLWMFSLPPESTLM